MLNSALLFNMIWSDLALAAEVDAPGSVEYCRVYYLWVTEGMPLPLYPWIRARACPPLPPLPPIPEGPLT